MRYKKRSPLWAILMAVCLILTQPVNLYAAQESQQPEQTEKDVQESGQKPEDVQGSGQQPEDVQESGQKPEDVQGSGQQPEDVQGSDQKPGDAQGDAQLQESDQKNDEVKETGPTPEDEGSEVTSDSLEGQLQEYKKNRKPYAAFFRSAVPQAVIGSEENPFQISSKEVLHELAKKVSQSYEIDGIKYQYGKSSYVIGSDFSMDMEGKGDWEGIQGFSGKLDGKNHTISGFAVAGQEKVGLFSSLAKEGTVENLTIAGSFSGRGYVGAFAGVNNGTIRNCSFSGTIASEDGYAGGITGFNYGTISECSAQGAVSAGVNGTGERVFTAGGIAGGQNGGFIENCSNAAAITVQGVNPNTGYLSGAGGICGENYTVIKGCENTGTVQNKNGYYPHGGGIVGYAGRGSEIKSCKNLGEIKGDYGNNPNTGGIGGYVSNAVLEDNTNSGTITVTGAPNLGWDNGGGIAGALDASTVVFCKNEGMVQSLARGGNGASLGGIGGIAYGGTSITKSYNTGEIKAPNGMAGGITAQMQKDVQIENVYNTGAITGASHVGGIVGNGQSSVKYAYNTGNLNRIKTNTQSYFGGIVGNLGSGESVIGCLALNSWVQGSYETGTGRIVGYMSLNNKDLRNNFGWEKMNVFGREAQIDIGVEERNGASLTSQEILDGTCFDDFSSEIWVKEAGKLPVLTGFTEGQSSGIPQHIIEDTAGEAPVHTLEGQGTESEPYLLSSREDLESFAGKIAESPYGANEFYKLTQDIDMGNQGWATVNSFRGSLDGCGFSIKNMNFKGTGLFTTLSAAGKVEGLRIEGALNQCAGAGGIFAATNYGTIQDCEFSGVMTGIGSATMNAGGITHTNNGTIANCFVEGSIVYSGTGGTSVGGIACWNYGSISSCGTSLEIQNVKKAGGIVCFNSKTSSLPGSIENCYARCRISATEAAAGIAVSQTTADTSIVNCYAEGGLSVSLEPPYASSGGFSIGGIVGEGTNGIVKDCVVIMDVMSYGEKYTTYKWDGRIGGKTATACTYENNQAWDGIQGKDGEVIAFDNTLVKNGSGVTKESLKDGTAWTQFSASPWSYAAGEMPVLQGLNGQNSSLPSYLEGEQKIELEGEGTEEKPYIIDSAQGLLFAAGKINGGDDAYAAAFYQLTADVDMNGIAWNPAGTEDNPFTGTFDGAFHKVQNLNVTGVRAGLFGYTKDAVISRVHVDGSMNGTEYAGGIVAVACKTEIRECVGKASVQGGVAGGILGMQQEGSVISCYSISPVSGDTAGGICGSSTGKIQHCYALGNVSGTIGAGGIVGDTSGTVAYCAVMSEQISGATAGRIGGNEGEGYSGNYVWSICSVNADVADGTDTRDGKGSFLSKICSDKTLFPEDVWNLQEGYYPQLGSFEPANISLSGQQKSGAELIDKLELSIEAPAGGGLPQTEILADEYTVALTWDLDAGEAFGYDTVYTVKGTVELQEGYQWAEDAELYINEVQVSLAAEEDGSRFFTYQWEKTGLPPITGAVSLEGTARYGQTLTAVLNGLPENAKPVYEWYRDGQKQTQVTGENYTLGKEDIGQEIYVVVTTPGFDKTLESERVTGQKAIPGIKIQGTADDKTAKKARLVAYVTGVNEHPKGTVSIYEGDKLLGKDLVLADGQASLVLTDLSKGVHTFKIVYTPAEGEFYETASAELSWEMKAAAASAVTPNTGDDAPLKEFAALGIAAAAVLAAVLLLKKKRSKAAM